MAESSTAEQQHAENFILFELAGTTYGVPSRSVRQMEMIEHITPVPNASSAIEGVIFSRGQVIPAINLRVRFGFERKPLDLRTRLIVVNSEDRVLGLIVDSAREFITIPDSAIQPPSEAISGLNGRYLVGIATLGERLILVLNVAEVIDLNEVSTVPPEGALQGGH